MKEDRAATVASAQPVSSCGSKAKGAESPISHDSTACDLHQRSSDLVLFLLDLEKIAPNSDFLRLAKDVAHKLMCEWRDFSCETWVPAAGASWKQDFSNLAFALAELWKITREADYREAGLEIIDYVNEIESKGQSLSPHVKCDRRTA